MFRFTIRELILLTVIVAMGCAWWVDRRQQKRTADDELVQNVGAIARNWAKEKGSMIKTQTPRFSIIDMRPDGSGGIHGDNLDWP